MQMTETFQTVETSQIDLRLQEIRQRDEAAEKHLLESIRSQGIRQPLLVVMPQRCRCLLLDGFKRLRCARRLGIGVVAVRCAEGDEQAGLLTLLRESREKGLSELEHGAVIDMLGQRFGMSLSRIASHLGCSVAWVSLRHGMIRSMSPVVRKAVLDGRFPPRCYLYGLRPFTRVKGVNSEMVDRFVTALGGRGHSTREIFLLTQAYFTGSSAVRQRIDRGEITSVLQACGAGPLVDGSEDTSRLIDDIGCAMRCMDRLAEGLPSVALDGEITRLRAHLATANLLRRISRFTRAMREFYDRTRKTLGGDGVVEARQEQAAHRSDAGAEPQDSASDYCRGWPTTEGDRQIAAAAAG
jgi:hypothetical protein